MADSLKAFLTWVRDALHFAPNWTVSLVLIVVSVIGTLVVHRIALGILIRMLRARHPTLLRIVTGTQGPSRLALLVSVMAVTIQVAPFRDEVAAFVSRLLIQATVIMLGWIAIAAIHIATELYLMRFRVDVADNLLARKHITQMRILTRVADVVTILLTAGFVLMTFPAVRQYGVSLFASAGVAGLVAGLAARPVLGNLFAGVQLAITQPIRLEDVVIVENEWGWIEEITSTYVVIRIWDLRRLIVPLTYFIEKPFQNWTREGSAILGTVMLYLDYRAPIDAIREQAKAIAEASLEWDRKVCGVQVTDTRESTIEVRILVSANTGGQAWNLRCEMREKMIAFLQREHPDALPRRRFEGIEDMGTTLPDQPPTRPVSERKDPTTGE
jgi:small-conductance mechanosensitive channel